MKTVKWSSFRDNSVIKTCNTSGNCTYQEDVDMLDLLELLDHLCDVEGVLSGLGIVESGSVNEVKEVS